MKTYEENVTVYERGIAAIEAIREKLLRRLDLASEEMKPRLRDALTQNDRALTALREALATAKTALAARRAELVRPPRKLSKAALKP